MNEETNKVELFRNAFAEKVQELGYIRAQLRIGRPSFMRLIMPFGETEDAVDPDAGFMEWGDRLEKELGVSLPWDWESEEGRRQRKSLLLSLFM